MSKVEQWKDRVDGPSGLPNIGSPSKSKSYKSVVGSPKSPSKKVNNRQNKRPGTTGGSFPSPTKSRVSDIFNATIGLESSATLPDSRLKRNTKDGSYGFHIKRSRKRDAGTASARFGDDDMSSIGDWSVTEQNSFFTDDSCLSYPQSPMGISRAASRSNVNSPPRNQGESIAFGDSGSWDTARMSSRGNFTARSSALSLFDSGSVLPPGGRPQSVTMKELLVDIRAKVDTGDAPPEYVRPLDELPKQKLSWNGRTRELVIAQPSFVPFRLSDSHASTQMNATFKIPRNWSPMGCRPAASNDNVDKEEGDSSTIKRSNTFSCVDYTIESDEEIVTQPVVNIIGCNQPVELILAKADQKLRRMHDHRIVADQKLEVEKTTLLAEINFRSTRHERHEEFLQFQRIQKGWMKSILTMYYMQRLWSTSKATYEKNLDVIKMIMAKKTIKQRLIIIVRRIRQNKVQRFIDKMGKASWILYLCLRIRKKRQAVDKCILFLNIYKDQRLVSFMVKQYFTKVHRCQRVARDMIGCTRGRMIALEKMWEQLEVKFLKYMLYKQAHSDITKKVAEKARKRSEKRDDVRTQAIPSKSVRVLKRGIDLSAIVKCVSRQGELWQKIDGRIENTLNKLRVSGSVDKRRSTEEIMEELSVPWHDRHIMLRELLMAKRREYLLLRESMDLTKPKAGMLGMYSDEDAALMLKGATKTVSQLLLRELHVEFDSKSIPPFYLFSYVSKSTILELINSEHERRKTFIITVDIEAAKHAVLPAIGPPKSTE